METRNRNASAPIPHSLFRIPHYLTLVLGSVLIFSHCVTAALDHDENQFVASAALLARRGLLPYRDYPYLHTPYGVFADAALFRWAGPSARLLLTARLFSAFCGLATVALLAAAVASLYRDRGRSARRWAAPAAVLLLVSNPLFATVTGLAWNHDAAEMLLAAATVLFLRNIRRGSYTARSTLATGALLGLSIGVRLTVAPAAAAFAGWALADARVPWRRRLAVTGLLLSGTAVALLPCGWLYWQAPRGFLFGNFGYPTLNTAYRIAHGSMSSSTTPVGKIVYFFSRVVFSSGTGFLVVLVASTAWLRRGRRTDASWLRDIRTPGRSGPGPSRVQGSGPPRLQGPGPSRLQNSETTSVQLCREEMTFLAVLILFLLAGSFAPAPMFIVYFYAPLPFAVLWLAYAWRPMLSPALPRQAELSPSPGTPGEGWGEGLSFEARQGEAPLPARSFTGQKAAALVLAFCCLACGVPAYRHLATAFRPSRWVPMEVHASGIALRRRLASAGAPPGAVLTLAPIIPLEGGLDIYESFATGPFAFRAAPMVPAAERPGLHLVDEFDLSQLLERRPPMAVLYDVEPRDEETPMLAAVPGDCWRVRLVHGSRFDVAKAGKRP